MKVLMLGWEFPPFIAGGLGTACHGLTKALDARGVKVTFLLPRPIVPTHATHVDLVTPTEPDSPEQTNTREPRITRSTKTAAEPSVRTSPFENVQFVGIPAGFHNPYQRQAGDHPVGRWVVRRGVRTFIEGAEEPDVSDLEPVDYETLAASSGDGNPPSEDYGGDLLEQVQRFARFCLVAARKHEFDVIHAHDWMTYPAGLLVARATGKPLVVHIHSTEFDRSGEHINQLVYDVERRGMHGAMRVIAVSQLTKNVVMRRYGVPDGRIKVVYNGVEVEPPQGDHRTGIDSKDKVVLYFGRITYQKGPEYFIAAARRVLEVMPDVKFVVAGSGDQATRMIEMAADLGIGHKVLFTGFLRGRDIKRVFSIADLYVMPSVSEPFGIAPLEAMSNDVPALISKSSGVSEVLTHVLKVDFWDTDDMANKIIAVLRHPPLRQTLQAHGAFEVRRINWEGAAARCERVYHSVIKEMTSTMAVFA